MDTTLRTPTTYAVGWARMPDWEPRTILPREERVGHVIARLREERGWSQQETADRAGLGQSTLSNIEQGKKRPERRTLSALEEAFGRPQGSLVAVAEREGPLPGESPQLLPAGTVVIPPQADDVIEAVDLFRMMPRDTRKRLIKIMYRWLDAPDPDDPRR